MLRAKYLSVPGSSVNANGVVPQTCANIGLTQGVNCAQVAGGLDVGSPLTNGRGLQDPTYGGSANTPGVGNGLDGIPDIALFNTVNPTNTTQSQFNGRVDANISEKDRLAFAIYWVPVSTTDYNGPVRAQNLWHHDAVNDAFSIIWDHTFSPTLLNQARANAAGWRWNEVNTNPQAPFGLPQGNINDIGTATNFNFFGAPGPSILNQWTYTYSDVLTKVLGRHNVKAGAEFTRLQYLNENIYGARPQFSFNNLWDFANDAPYQETGSFDSTTGIPSPNRQDDRQNLLGIFVQDDFKLRPNLTINVGLRWSYFGSLYTKQDNLDVLQLGAGSSALTGMNIRVGGHLADPQKTNFGPTVGFAWSPTMFDNKLVFRGGFGMAFNQNEIAITASSFGNPPNVVAPTFTCSYPYTTNPNCAGTGILYETAADVNSIFGYAPNSATVTTFGSNNLPTSGATGVIGFPQNQQAITNYHYSLDMQYQLPFDSVMFLGYQGNLTRHLLIQENYNVVAAAAGYAFNPLINRVGFWTNSGNANYNAMIASLNHNFSHNFQLAAQYTWSKAMDENSGPYYEDPYPYDIHAAYGRAAYNVANAFKVWGLWQPVIFKGAHNWAEKIVGGWSLSGIWNLHSGFPWDPTYNTVGGVYYSGSDYGSLRPGGVNRNLWRQHGEPHVHECDQPQLRRQRDDLLPGSDLHVSSWVPGLQRTTRAGHPAQQPQRTWIQRCGRQPVEGVRSAEQQGVGRKREIRISRRLLQRLQQAEPELAQIDNNLGTVNPNGSVTPNSDFGVIRDGARQQNDPVAGAVQLLNPGAVLRNGRTALCTRLRIPICSSSFRADRLTVRASYPGGGGNSTAFLA